MVSDLKPLEKISVKKESSFNFNKFFNRSIKDFKNKIEIKVTLTLEEAYFGIDKTVNYELDHKIFAFNYNFPKGTLHNQSFLIKQELIDKPVFFKANIKKHSFFRLDGKTIISFEKINILRAIIGGQHLIQTLDSPLIVDLPIFSLENYNIILKNKGLSGGSHIIYLKPYVPDLDNKLKNFLREYL